MVLTAAAVAVGGSVILFDPIFQGLAVALIGGEIAATVLSRVAVPVLYFMVQRRGERATTPHATPSRDGDMFEPMSPTTTASEPVGALP
jgi:hypothetical protein